MCGRFGLIPTPDQVAELFALAELEDFPPRYNIAPTQPILMVMSGPPREPGSNLPDRKALLVRWGLWPAWAKDTKRLPLLINARSEEAAEKPAFRNAMRHRRALAPASGFFEWQKTGPKSKQAYWIRPKGGGIVAFGGLMETWHEPGGSEIDTGAILTTSANSDLAIIHDRMPVVIKPQDFARWLDCRNYEPRDVADLMQPVEPGYFERIPVSDRVNSHANIGPENIEPVELALTATDQSRGKSSTSAESASAGTAGEQLKLI
jgi:putative SOS response-associated peptidase YedK